MKVTIVFGNTTVWWRLKDAEDVRQNISNFPFAKFHEPRINVQIRPSRTHGPGRIVCLWQKINFLVDILQELQCPPHVQVTLYGGWHKGEKARQSILYTKGYRPDHDIAVLPFTRLPKSQWDYTLYDHLDAVVSSEPEGPEHSLLYRLKIGEAFDSAEIDSLCLDTRIFLDTALDKTVGPTADLLRLSRFQHWYQAGNEWNVSYEEQFLAGLVNHLPVVIKHDPRLSSALRRYRTLILAHHFAFREQHFEDVGYETEDEDYNYSHEISCRISWCKMRDELIQGHKWESGVFLDRWPRGIPELRGWLKHLPRSVFKEYVGENDKVRAFWNELIWWAYDAAEFLHAPRSEGKWCCLCRFLERPCAGAGSMTRLGRVCCAGKDSRCNFCRFFLMVVVMIQGV